jgi:hypothetical protein
MLELCCLCEAPTGRAGRGDDSIYKELLLDWGWQDAGEVLGPLCEECYRELRDAGVIDDQ